MRFGTVRLRCRDDDLTSADSNRGALADAGAAERFLGQPDPAAPRDDDLVGTVAALFADPTVADPNRAVCELRGARVVADDDHGRAVRPGEVGHELEDDVCRAAVELSGGLVREQEPRPVRECRADRDALLLATRQLGGIARAVGPRGRPRRAARARAGPRRRRPSSRRRSATESAIVSFGSSASA